MMAATLKWMVIIAAVINFGFMAFDGTRALITGDYVRPKSGEFTGQLGPWSKLVETVGIDPESTLMKSIFLVWGVSGLILAFYFAIDYSWGWKAMLILNLCSLWYLLPGTGFSILQIILLTIVKFLK